MARSIIVIGAGIIGASVAWHLARSGAAVTVLDAGLAGTGASGRSFGWLNASFHLNAAHFRLRNEGIAAWHRLEAAVPGLGIQWNGCLSWESEAEAEAARLAALGYPVELVGRAGIAARAPGLGAPPESALWLPGEGAVDPALAARRLLEAAAEFGAVLWTGCAVTAVEAGPAGVSVAVPGARLEADDLVVAAGTGAPALLQSLGLALPMLHRPAVMLRTRPLRSRLGTGPASPVLVSPGLEFRQDTNGRILAPTSPGHQGDASDRIGDRPDRLAEDALARLAALLPGVDLAWERAILAERPVPGDGFPVIGPSGVARVWTAVLHSGATLGAITGELLAAEILGAAPSPLLEGFRPARFAG